MNVVSFVDRDMVMCYFGGGIGHLKNPPLQVLGFDPIDPSSEEMPVEDEDEDDRCSGTNEDLGTILVVQQPSKDVVNGGELEDDVDDEDDDNSDSDGDESGDQTDEDEDDEGDSEDDDYGYA